jgi:hypothetical protein
MPLTFPRQYRQLDAEAGSVIFPGQSGEKTISCRITRETLRERFGAGPAGPDLLAAFDRNRPRIESVAARKFDLADPAQAVSLTLTPADL